MKSIQTISCAAIAAAIALLSHPAQAIVIAGNQYTPLNLKIVVSVIGTTGAVQQKSATAKNLLSDLINEQGFNYPSGTTLALGPGQDVYAVTSTTVLDDLTTEGYFYFSGSSTIFANSGTYNVTAWKDSEAGTVIFDYADDADLATLQNNALAFSLNGTYIYNEKDSAPVNGLLTQSASFSSANLSGGSFISGLDNADILPMNIGATGTASGKVNP
jgi:hypothetical protein